MSTVAVLMSSYNGEAFIREQIDSIIDQRGVDVQLFVRDDGSSDTTLEILNSYVATVGIQVICGDNVGVGNSFMELLYAVPSGFDYYAFADQDDIWHCDKLNRAISLLKESGKLLYASNQECVDSEGKSLGLRYSEDKYIFTEPAQIISKNMIAGCTMVFTSELRDILVKESNRPTCALLRNRIHDVWVAAVASLYDGIIYDKCSYIAYRQHGGNVVGAYEGGIAKKVKQRLKKVFNKEGRNGRSKLARQLQERFPSLMDRYALAKVCAGGKLGILKNQKILRTYTGESYFGFLSKVLLGLF